jgi:biotin--protein ligase
MASDAGRGDGPTDATYTVSAWRQTEDDPAPWERTLAATPEVTLVRGDDSSRDDASTFDASAYYSRLRTRRDGRALLTARELPSTQNLISDNAAHAPGSLIPGAVCVADAQVSGKGRGGNEWSSPPGCLMFSLLTRHREGRTLPFIQYIATMAAVDAIQEGADDALIAAGANGHRKGTGTAVDAKIKWPNDLYSGGLKIGGVLCTSTYSDGGFDVVVGVGINLDNATPTTCVNDIVRKRLEKDGLRACFDEKTKLTRESLMAGFANRFEAMCAMLDECDSFDTLEGGYLRQWLHTDQEVTLEEDGEKKVRLVVKGITRTGYLLAIDASGEKYELHPDGNSLDFFKGLVRKKLPNR